MDFNNGGRFLSKIIQILIAFYQILSTEIHSHLAHVMLRALQRQIRCERIKISDKIPERLIYALSNFM